MLSKTLRLLIALLASSSAFSFEAQSERQQRILDLYIEGLKGKPELLEHIMSPKWVSIDPIPGQKEGLDAYLELAKEMYAAIEDYRWEVEDMIEQDDTVVIRATFSGKHTFSVSGETPTGKPFEIKTIEIHHFNDDGLIERTYHLEDWLKMLGQVGALNTEH